MTRQSLWNAIFVLLLFTLPPVTAQMLPNEVQTLIGYLTLGDRENVADILRVKPSLMNAVDSRTGYPPIHVLMTLKANPRVLDEVFRYRFDVNQKVRGETPLTLGVALGNMEALTRLLKAGAEVNARNQAGNTALQLALGVAGTGRSGSLELINFLLEAGADPNALDKEGRPPLMIVLGLAVKKDALGASLITALLANGAKKDPIILIKGAKVQFSKMMAKTAPPKTLKAYNAAP